MGPRRNFEFDTSADGDLIEVTGPLKPGDKVVKRATDEIREGAALR